jgi:diguanylate cyclase (GGDEF)-like protein
MKPPRSAPIGGARRPAPVGPAPLQVALIALSSAAIVFVAGDAAAFWLCVPAALVASTGARGRGGTAVSAAVVVAAAATAVVIFRGVGALPPPLLAVLVPGASVAVLVTVRERLERERDAMRDHALNDPLTGIPNRRSLLGRADYEIARHTRTRASFAVVMLDLDGFKPLNDRFGHAAGDDLLREVAVSVKRSLRAPDTVARLGGDEFCVLAPETDERGIERLTARITRAVGSVTAGTVGLRASLGIAVFPADGRTVSELLEVADERLMITKRERQRDRSARRAA